MPVNVSLASLMLDKLLEGVLFRLWQMKESRGSLDLLQ
jgi:hypothetical protein